MDINTIAEKYPEQFELKNGCVYRKSSSRGGEKTMKLCNFAPCISVEKTVSDGIDENKVLTLTGVHSDGSELPEAEINGGELAGFNWLIQKWGAKCNLEVGASVKDHLRYLLQCTSVSARRIRVYEHTGWRKIDGRWVFLLPDVGDYDVCLKGKLASYRAESFVCDGDLNELRELTERLIAPKDVVFTLIAYTFLTPLNEFLNKAGCMPKFVLNLTGRTGTRKSTLSALFLSFFGSFSASNLPLSFRDTANSILHNAFALKDVLTCIDDFHPGSHEDARKLTATAQSIMRAYGDRTGRGRLRSDSSLMESRPPLGNAIITSEFPPDIGESGTARYFSVELGEDSVDLAVLTRFQKSAEKGVFRRAMYAYTEWIKGFVCDDDTLRRFCVILRKYFEYYRDEFTRMNLSCHGRVPETAAWLRLGMKFFTMFLSEKGALTTETAENIEDEFELLIKDNASRQIESIENDRPTTVFLKKLYSLIESGAAAVLKRDMNIEFLPPDFVGIEDNDFLYLNKDAAHRAVKRLCDQQGETFAISSKALAKALAEEGIVKKGSAQNTVQVRFAGKQRRFIALKKNLVEYIVSGREA